MAYRIFFDEAINPFCLLDSRGNVRDWNKQSEKIFGFTKDEVLGKPDPTFPDSDKLKKFLNSVKEKGKDVETLALLTKDGEELDVEVTGVYHDGEYFLMKRDLTYRRYAYVEKMKAMGELVSGIAHQINSPLNSVILLTQNILESIEDNGDWIEDIKIIEKQARHMRSVIEKILNYVRFSETKTEFCLMDVVDEIVELYNNTLRGHRIIVKPLRANKDTCEFCSFFGDKSGLEQIIVNLVTNAVDAMPKGGIIEISCRVEGSELVLMVKDQGIGIPKEHLRKIFQPFFSTKGSKGSGLGLAIVQRIVEEHKGQILVHSVPLKGTTFVLKFPLIKGKREHE